MHKANESQILDIASWLGKEKLGETQENKSLDRNKQ